MSPKIRIGLIVGVIVMILGYVVRIGFFGPLIALVAGAAAGFFTARREHAPTRSARAQNGAIAGGIAGFFMLVSQLILTWVVLSFVMNSDAAVPPSQRPDMGNTSEVIAYYVNGSGFQLLFGVIDLVAAAVGGAVAGHLTTDEMNTPPAEPTM